MKYSWSRLLGAAAACWAVSGAVHAANDYPNRPIRIIVPYAPGGGTDLFSRTLGNLLSERFGQPVIVENKPGALTLLGNQAIADAEPDGYTIGMISSATTVLPLTNKNFTIDARKDFTPISNLVSGNYALVVHPSLPVKSVAELIEYGKANPDKLNFASAGGAIDMVISAFREKSEMPFITVPYKGIAPARLALLSNEIQVLLEVVGVAKEMDESGKMRFLAVTGDQRDSLVPEFPTVSESGLPGFKADFWWGYGGPAGMPDEVVRKLNHGIVEALKDPGFLKQIKANGNTPVGNTPEAFAKQIEQDAAMWAEVAKAAGIKPE